MVVSEYLCIVFFMMQATSEELQQAGLPTPMKVDDQAGFIRCMDIYFFGTALTYYQNTGPCLYIINKKVKAG